MLRARNVVDSQAAAAAAAAAASAAHARGHAPAKPYASRFAPGRTPSATVILGSFAAIAVMIVLFLMAYEVTEPVVPDRFATWGIIGSPATRFVAGCVERELRRRGFAVSVFADAPDAFPLDFYIVLSPGDIAPARLPPTRKLIVYRAAAVEHQPHAPPPPHEQHARFLSFSSSYAPPAVLSSQYLSACRLRAIAATINAEHANCHSF
jgi:hypothetical protein